MSSFKCPECGSTKIRSKLNVSTDLSTGGGYSSPCTGCGRVVGGDDQTNRQSYSQKSFRTKW